MSSRRTLTGRPKAVLRRLAARLARAGWVWPLAAYYAWRTRFFNPLKSSFTASPENGRAPRVLALHPERLEADLRAVAATGRVKIIPFPFDWQGQLVSLFFGPELRGVPYSDIPSEAKAALRQFLMRFLPRFYWMAGVEAVVSPNFMYVQDQEWAAVTGAHTPVAYTVLYKENLKDPGFAMAETLRQNFKLVDFGGDQIMVGGEGPERLIVDSGLAPPDKVISCGMPRLDDLFGRARQRPVGEAPRRVVFFSFSLLSAAYYARLKKKPNVIPRRGEPGMWRLFDGAHQGIARMALKRPDVQFVIKAKWGGRWLEAIHESLALAGLDPAGIPNLTITDQGQSVDYVLDSRVVIGFNSTTMLEGLAAGRPVINPLFGEALDPEYRGYILFTDEDGAFYPAKDEAEFERLVLENVDEPAVAATPKSRRARDRLIKRFFHADDGRAAERCAEAIKAAVQRKRAASVPGVGRPAGQDGAR